MYYTVRIAFAVLIAAVVYLHARGSQFPNPEILALIALLGAGIIFFLDRILKPKSDRLLYIAAGVFSGLLSGFLLQRVIEAQGEGMGSIVILGYLLSLAFFVQVGYRIALTRGQKLIGGGGFGTDQEGGGNPEKILDTSVIIDGRILDIAETHFIDGPFIIPNFVLREIQLISDSPDPVKRNRGRRGLEMLNKLQQHGSVKVKISYLDYPESREVDAKLVKLAMETGGKLVTNDFNLNKVAELQGVEVLNLNNLTNALKPVVLPGEDIFIDVIKEGKDENQGIGYLEDGTMVVIENGGTLLGKTVRVNVTSIIQTAAGKMIFTRAAGVVEQDEQTSSRPEKETRGGRSNGGGRRGRGGRGRDGEEALQGKGSRRR